MKSWCSHEKNLNVSDTLAKDRKKDQSGSERWKTGREKTDNFTLHAEHMSEPLTEQGEYGW